MVDEGDDNKQQDQAYELIATEQTLEALGWVGDRLPVISETDVIVVARHDIVDPGDENKPDIDAIGVANLKNLFNEAGLDPDMFLEEELKEITQNVLNFNASATGFDMDGDGKNDLGIIIAPDFNMTPADNVAEIAGLPPGSVKDNVPGTAEDYTAWTMFHEARHIRQAEAHEAYDSKGSLFEGDSDKQAIIEMEKAKAEGMPVNMDVARIMQESRLIPGLAQDHHQSMIMALINLAPGTMIAAHSTQYVVEGDKHINEILPRDNQASYPAVLKVNSMVNIAVGEFLLTQSKVLLAAGESPESSGMLSKEDCEKFETNKFALAERATEYALSDPVLGYAALKSLVERGYIQDNTAEAKYAARVTAFYEKHVDMNALANGAFYEPLRQFFNDMPEMVPGVRTVAENIAEPAQDTNIETDSARKTVLPQIGR